VGPSGDLLTAPQAAEVNNRVIRRLLTNPGEYIWHSEYGGAVGRYVGEPFSPGIIEGTILSQLQLEYLVASNPSPEVRMTKSSPNTFSTTSVVIEFQVLGAQSSGIVSLDLGS
jgi:hypothetical protein